MKLTTNKALIGLYLAASTILILSSPARSDGLSLALFTSPLGEVLKTAAIEPFREVTKIDVKADNRDWGIGAVRAKIESDSGVWDLVTVEDAEAIQGCDEGYFAKIDKSKIAGLEDFDLMDDKLECAVPFVFYGTVLAYDKARIGDEPTSWADLWDVKKWPGRRGMNKTPMATLELALMADGVERDQVYAVLATPEGVDRAFKKLDELKPNIVWWQNPGQSRQMLAAGEIVMSVTYDNGIRFFNKTQGTNFGLVRSNTITHVNYWALVEGSKNVDNAYAFLNYAAKPEVQAAVTNGLAISTPNRKAMDFVQSDLKPFLTSNPNNLKESLKLDPQFWVDNYDALSQRFDAWVSAG
ncbi:ABC transporter substrate-binding protein [Oryzicola mucosus]|uniref:ABC transporter substrate-binding protein n=1 Tax=Oryzicola mucosus TaxID=2767425 RepID=A0A8J6PMM7_9HYPH|nr:ABC transporter substrate-binding protein [Oryzicola mucosus]MBD0417439.1 ABC transporter substrate-binding protein [Oryzicola mucosus]